MPAVRFLADALIKPVVLRNRGAGKPTARETSRRRQPPAFLGDYILDCTARLSYAAFCHVSTTFEEIVSRLAETVALVTAAKDRMEGELNVGRDIQMSMVPLNFPALPEHDEFSIFATIKPAAER